MIERLTNGRLKAVVEEIEGMRARGEYAGVLAETNKLIPHLLPVDREDFERQGNNVRIARIHTDTHMSLAKRSWNALTVAYHLAHAKKSLLQATTLTEQIDVNPNYMQPTTEKPYAFSAEVQRDRANYLLVLASLTGNTTYFDSALDILQKILTKSNPNGERSIIYLTEFERGLHRFYQDPSIKNFESVHTFYLHAAGHARINQNWGRLGVISAKFLVASWQVRRLGPMKETIENYHDSTSMDKNVRGTFIKEVVKHSLKPWREKIWKMTTPPQENFSDLDLH